MNADVAAYLDALPPEQRAALVLVREIIAGAAPLAVEGVSYGVPAFKLDGPLVSYGAGKAHCALYVQSPALMRQMAEQLIGLDTSTGTIRFKPDAPLPAELVRQIVAARIAENAARAAKRKTR